MNDMLLNIVILLAAAVLLVPLAARLRLGAIVGYLCAGMVVGPWGLDRFPEREEILQVAELGVVLLLFLIGLELQPRRLWELRHSIIGFGGSQMLLTTLGLAGGGILWGVEPKLAILIGLVLSLSSTAFALQLIEERRLTKTKAGQVGFAVLLFQDIAVIPMLALIPLLGPAGGTLSLGGMGRDAILGLAVIAAIVVIGRILLQPLYRIVAGTGSRELFTAFSLLLVIGVSLLVNAVGMSMALGAFIGGVVLAESEYRHAIEIDVQPFKGLLMGLFFIAVGMAMDLGLWFTLPWVILGLAVTLLAIKFGILLVLAKLFRVPGHQSWLLAALLCQGGEFGFAVFGMAASQQVLAKPMADLLIVVIAVSMMLTPVVLAVAGRIVHWRFARTLAVAGSTLASEAGPVIIAGFGRYGQVIDRLLSANRIPTVIIDHDPEQIELLRRFGHKVLYGDATRLDLLREAGAGRARLLIVALDAPEVTLRLVDLARQHFPELPLLVRVRNRTQAYEMLDRGIQNFERETFASALNTGVKALRQLGLSPEKASEAARVFHRHDEATLRRLHPLHQDQERVISLVNQARGDLETLMNAEQAQAREEQ